MSATIQSGERTHDAARVNPRLKQASKTGKSLLAHVILLTGCIFFVAPLLFMLSTSLKAMRQITRFPPEWIPDPVIWANYPAVFTYAPMHLYFFNTMIIVLPTVIGATLVSSLTAYAFARLRAPGKNAMFVLVLATLMLPSVVTLVPTYVLFAKIGWVGTFLPLTIPPLAGSAFYIFLLRQFFMTIPRELEDAALIDGCSRFRIYYNIVLPLAKPVLATVTIFAFMNAWNDYLGPLIYLGNKNQYTLSLGLQAFVQYQRSEWGLLMAASTMMIVPVIFIFFVAQKSFVQGITLTGLKG
ncbi:MAG: carbohydrate ABC transporter permease [Caldilineaceae bacterium]|jgi:multiple sugar transport system permease protein|nr:carbohydrate ABC transporter permease [Caldilineaceae bacterium]